jgi:hypothetical protein
MSDSVIDAIRQVDPCPDELPPPPIEIVRRRLRNEPVGAEPPASPRRPRLGVSAVVLSSAAVAAVAVLAIVLLAHAHRAGSPAARGRAAVGMLVCRAQVEDGVLPTWARTGFSEARPRMPYALGGSRRIAAILWGPLDSPPAANVNNKILWVSRVPVRPGSDLTIRAQRMDGTDRLGDPVTRTVTGGPGPSIINLPSPGCWRLTLRWSGWTDHIDLQYKPPA